MGGEQRAAGSGKIIREVKSVGAICPPRGGGSDGGPKAEPAGRAEGQTDRDTPRHINNEMAAKIYLLLYMSTL